MTTGMAWCPVSNMVITKNKVISGAAQCPVSHGVSPKRAFLNLLNINKINNKSRQRYELYTFLKKLLEKFYYYQNFLQLYDKHIKYTKMINVSLDDLKLVAKNRDIKDCENKSKEDLIKILSEPKPKIKFNKTKKRF